MGLCFNEIFPCTGVKGRVMRGSLLRRLFLAQPGCDTAFRVTANTETIRRGDEVQQTSLLPYSVGTQKPDRRWAQ